MRTRKEGHGTGSGLTIGRIGQPIPEAAYEHTDTTATTGWMRPSSPRRRHRKAIALPIASVKEIAMRQVERMLAQLKEQYRYLGVLKKRVFEALAGINDVSMVQRQEMIDWVEQLST